MKKVAIIACCLAGLALSIFLLLCRDDARVLVPTDIDLYAGQPERSDESFSIFLKVLRQERPYQDFPAELLKNDKKEDNYEDLLRENSDLILQNYAIAKEVLNELKVLNSFEGIGDSTNSYESEIVKFGSIRDMLQAVSFYTELNYVENSEDKSLDQLLQIRSIASKWLPHTRTLAHSMIAMVVLDQIRDSLLFIQHHLGPDEVQQVMKTYSDIPNYSQAIENALYSEYCMTADALDGVVSERKCGLGYLLFKRNNTLNIYGTYLEEQIDFSRDEDWDSMQKTSASLENEFERIHLTNWGGWTFLAMAIPAMNKVSHKAHEAETADLELVEKLQQGGGINSVSLRSTP